MVCVAILTRAASSLILSAHTHSLGHISVHTHSHIYIHLFHGISHPLICAIKCENDVHNWPKVALLSHRIPNAIPKQRPTRIFYSFVRHVEKIDGLCLIFLCNSELVKLDEEKVLGIFKNE
jgi:hypothetical protein